MRRTTLKCLLLTVCFTFSGAIAPCSAELPNTKLLVSLPDYVPTPDGMEVAANGDLVVACPNYGDSKQPACIIRITPELKVSKWITVPVMKETGRACPMGIAFDPKGNLYISDNQNWPTGNGEKGEVNQGRILRMKIRDGKVLSTTVVAQGISHPNGVRYRNGKLYVTVSMLPKVKREDGLITSAVYVFPANGKEITISNTLADKQILTTFPTRNKFCQYGVDGIVFDSKGDLFIGNFGDGVLHRVTINKKGKCTSNEIFAKTDHDYSLDPAKPGFIEKATKAKMRTTDGICIDENDNIYVADFSNNALAKVSPDGKISVVSQNGDTNGADGKMDQPGEPIFWQGKLVVTSFDMVTGPDKVNSEHDKPYTISYIKP